jgi:hypothetical protein
MGANDVFEPGSEESKKQDYNRNFSGGKLMSGKGLDFGYGLGVYTPSAVENWMKGPAVRDANPLTYDWAGYGRTAEQQQNLNDMLLARAQGQTPSVAEAQLNQATQANRAAAQSMAASARGGAMQQQAAQRNAQTQGVQAQQQSAGQAATLRAQEQSAAMQQYSQALQAQQNAEMQRQLGMGQNQIGYTGAESERMKMQRQQQQAGIGGIVGAVGGLVGALSDERAKTDIRSADKDVDEFLDAVRPSKYRYREGYGDPGTHYGVVAQDLEKTPMGRTMVSRDEQGMRHVEFRPTELLAVMADMHDRLRNLERGK